jgi:hypothetical protein
MNASAKDLIVAKLLLARRNRRRIAVSPASP